MRGAQLRMLRIVRAVRALRKWRAMMDLLTAFGMAIPQVANLMILMFVVMFIFAIIGMQVRPSALPSGRPSTHPSCVYMRARLCACVQRGDRPVRKDVRVVVRGIQ